MAWTITAEERAKHDQQFVSLNPVNGFITGDQARGFFLKSTLPPALLAQIWSLADLNKDGKMDKKEFSIAMHLIQKKLQGFQLPSTLPDSMKVDPMVLPTMGPGSMGPHFQAAPSTMGMPGMMPPRPPMMGPMGMGPAPPMMGPMVGQPHIPIGGMMPPPMAPGMGSPVASSAVTGSPGPGGRRSSKPTDWSMPQASKLRHSQQFNVIDRNRSGFLTGAHARNILSQIGLPTPALAQIWNLSDIDKDGRLSCDEYCIAMHLIDMFKTGAELPTTIPPELVASVSKTKAQIISQELDGETNGDVKWSAASFEDKRKENMVKGQAELERRRQVLMVCIHKKGIESLLEPLSISKCAKI